MLNHYKQFAQQAPPQQIYEVAQQAYQQMPQDQKEGIFHAVMGALNQNGVDPQQAGVQGNQPTAQNYAQANK